MKTLTEQYIEKLEGLILNLKIGFVSKTVSSLTLEVIERLESDIAALKANMEQEEHETCDGCKMFINNLCMLDVSVCPDCFERSQWTAQKQKKQKPKATSTAWECPRCHKIHAWFVRECDCPPNVITSTTYKQ